MSRIGLKPITIPAGVDVNVNGTTVTVKGPNGTANYGVLGNNSYFNFIWRLRIRCAKGC